MAASWKNTNKFRLFVIVLLALLTNLSLSQDELWDSRELVSAFLSALISGFAYLQCPETRSRGET
jgi:hypothetical protein